MSNVVRAALALFLVLVALFCVYGFMATFEPLPRSVQWTWRILYGAVGLASVGVIGWLLIDERK